MPRSLFLLIFTLSCTLGCAGRFMIEPTPADHPASPRAPEAPFDGVPSPLIAEPQDQVRTRMRQQEMEGMEHHKHGDRRGSEEDQNSSGRHPPQHRTKPEVPEKTSPEGAGAEAGASGTGRTYVCPMHSEIVRERPGTCPKCNMELVRNGRGSR